MSSLQNEEYLPTGDKYYGRDRFGTIENVVKKSRLRSMRQSALEGVHRPCLGEEAFRTTR